MCRDQIEVSATSQVVEGSRLHDEQSVRGIGGDFALRAGAASSSIAGTPHRRPGGSALRSCASSARCSSAERLDW